MTVVTCNSHPRLHRVLWSQASTFFIHHLKMPFREQARIEIAQNKAFADAAEQALAQLRQAEIEYLCSGEADETFDPIGVDISTVNRILETYVPPGEE